MKMKKTAPTKEKTDVLITVAADLVEPTKPTPKAVIVSSNTVTNSTKNNTNSENNSESKRSTSGPGRNKNKNDVGIRRPDGNDNITRNSTDVNTSSGSNDISNNMLIIGASLLNHIQSSTGVTLAHTTSLLERYPSTITDNCHSSLDWISVTKYKKIVHKAYFEYKTKFISKLRLLQSENPKNISKLLKGKKNGSSA